MSAAFITVVPQHRCLTCEILFFELLPLQSLPFSFLRRQTVEQVFHSALPFRVPSKARPQPFPGLASPPDAPPPSSARARARARRGRTAPPPRPASLRPSPASPPAPPHRSRVSASCMRARNWLSLRISLTAPLNSRLCLWTSRRRSCSALLPPCFRPNSRLRAQRQRHGAAPSPGAVPPARAGAAATHTSTSRGVNSFSGSGLLLSQTSGRQRGSRCPTAASAPRHSSWNRAGERRLRQARPRVAPRPRGETDAASRCAAPPPPRAPGLLR